MILHPCGLSCILYIGWDCDSFSDILHIHLHIHHVDANSELPIQCTR